MEMSASSAGNATKLLHLHKFEQL